MTTNTFDSRCWDLADTFLSDVPQIHTHGHADALATEIQQVIEDYIAREMDAHEHGRLVPPHGSGPVATP